MSFISLSFLPPGCIPSGNLCVFLSLFSVMVLSRLQEQPPTRKTRHPSIYRPTTRGTDRALIDQMYRPHKAAFFSNMQCSGFFFRLRSRILSSKPETRFSYPTASQYSCVPDFKRPTRTRLDFECLGISVVLKCLTVQSLASHAMHLLII